MRDYGGTGVWESRLSEEGRKNLVFCGKGHRKGTRRT